MREISLAFSSCPNDTFTFHAMLRGLIDTGSFQFTPNIHDIETLNAKAVASEFQVSKLSFAALMALKDKYQILDSGAALGYGCGPLVIAKSADIDLKKARVAIPGEFTTAHLLLRLWNDQLPNIEMTSFEQILPGIASGYFDAGVIIHEGRFVFPDYGCVKIIDLGEWWESKTGLPIPLGCIGIRTDPETLGFKADIERMLQESIQYAFDHPTASREFVKSYAQKMDDKIIDAHIRLYVNEFSLSLGETGRRAIDTLQEIARQRGFY